MCEGRKVSGHFISMSVMALCYEKTNGNAYFNRLDFDSEHVH
jgi:hypothetical protein